MRKIGDQRTKAFCHPAPLKISLPAIATPLIELGVDGGATGDLLVVETTPIVTTTLDLEGCTDGWGGLCPLRDLVPIGVEHVLVGLPRGNGPFRVHVGVLDERLCAFGPCVPPPYLHPRVLFSSIG